MLFDDPIPGLVTAATATGLGIYAAVPIREGQRLYRISGTLRATPTRHSMQVAATVHIEPGEASWRFINHACEPNLVVDFSNWRFQAARDIAEGEELSFNYLTMERELVTPFDCRCGARGCFGVIGGYAKLGPAHRLKLHAHLAAHLRQPSVTLASKPATPARRLTPADFGVDG